MRASTDPLPQDFWQAIFGNAAPVAVEIGPGRGQFLIANALGDSRRNFFAIERSHSRARAIQEKIDLSGLHNARVIQGDASCVLRILPDACVATYDVQFPDPWWKRRHHRRRLWNAAFVLQLRRTLVPGGTVEYVTDVPAYFAAAQGHLNADPGLEQVVTTTDTAASPSTAFAHKARLRGASIFLSIHRRRPDRAPF